MRHSEEVFTVDVMAELTDPEHDRRLHQLSIDQAARFGKELAEKQEEAFIEALIGMDKPPSGQITVYCRVCNYKAKIPNSKPPVRYCDCPKCHRRFKVSIPKSSDPNQLYMG